MASNQSPRRKSNRFAGYDYREPGGYFVTLCSKDMLCLFGEIKDGIMLPSSIGEIVHSEWFRISALRETVVVHQDEFILMPNHIHAIVWIMEMHDDEANIKNEVAGLKSNSLGSIIGQYKSKTSGQVNCRRKTPESTIWQRNYYDHIIRNDNELAAIQKYIRDNPAKWEEERNQGNFSYVPNILRLGDRSGRPNLISREFKR